MMLAILIMKRKNTIKTTIKSITTIKNITSKILERYMHLKKN
jgi:hypothetical protein